MSEENKSHLATSKTWVEGQARESARRLSPWCRVALSGVLSVVLSAPSVDRCTTVWGDQVGVVNAKRETTTSTHDTVWTTQHSSGGGDGGRSAHMDAQVSHLLKYRQVSD